MLLVALYVVSRLVLAALMFCFSRSELAFALQEIRRKKLEI